nr:MAG TPA: hypothetical protein [Caudoviricetes sp.]
MNNLNLYTVIVFGIFVLCLLLGLGFALTMWSAPCGIFYFGGMIALNIYYLIKLKK